MFRQENYDLSAHNTFRMKVRCACFIEYESLEELLSLDLSELPQPVKHIGEGSNLLFTGDFPGTILHSNIEFIKYVDMGFDEVPVMVGAGVHFDDLVAQTCRHGLWGLENLSLIPGEAGAAVVQNIGAYGVEIGDLVSGVVCYDTLERKKVRFSAADCAYAYRDSFFKHQNDRYIVTSVLLRLSRAYKPTLTYKGISERFAGRTDLTPMEVREAIIAIRRDKLPDPDLIGSAGSFFKNPVIDTLCFSSLIDRARARLGPDVQIPHYLLPGGFVKVPAAWLIDSLGLKGAREGGAGLYEKQPLVMVNSDGNASPGDILALESRIVSEVADNWGITLYPEVEHLPGVQA